MKRNVFCAVLLMVALAIAAFSLGGCAQKLTDLSLSPKSSSGTGSSTSSSSSGSLDSASEKALKKWVADAQSGLPAEEQKYKSTYSSVTLTSEGDNTVVYTFTYVNQMDEATTKSGIDAAKSSIEPTVKNTLIPSLKSFGVKNPVAKYVYLNADGSVIDTLTYP